MVTRKMINIVSSFHCNQKTLQFSIPEVLPIASFPKLPPNPKALRCSGPTMWLKNRKRRTLPGPRDRL